MCIDHYLAGTGSDDTYVVFDEKVDSKGMTLSFKSGNNYINAHYQKYFKEKGYDAALKETGEHHTKIGFPTIYTVSKVFTLYSQNCCGPTGAGGDGKSTCFITTHFYRLK